jgi:hypothetical protein
MLFAGTADTRLGISINSANVGLSVLMAEVPQPGVEMGSELSLMIPMPPGESSISWYAGSVGTLGHRESSLVYWRSGYMINSAPRQLGRRQTAVSRRAGCRE